jgi:hypothetical protein
MKKRKKNLETVIDCSELADHVAVIRDGFAHQVVEALKYYLFLKAGESYPEKDISAWYQNQNGENLVFHIYGIKKTRRPS